MSTLQLELMITSQPICSSTCRPQYGPTRTICTVKSASTVNAQVDAYTAITNVNDKKTAVKGRGGKRKCGGKEEGKGAERKEESTIEFIEMRRPVTEGDFVDVRDAAVVAERADRLRVLLGLLDAQCELLDWRDYLDDSFDSLISGIEDVDAQQPIPHHPDPPAAHDDSRLSVDAAVRMLFVERSADRSLDRSVNQGGILDHSLDSSVNQGGVLDRTMDRDGNPDHSLDRTVERVGILERSTDRSLDHSVNQGGILDRTGEHVGILDHSADRSLDLAEAEASHLAHAESTSGAVDYGYGCLDPSIVTEPCRSDPLSSIIQTAAYGNNVTPLPPAKPLRPTATTSMLGFDFNTPARRDEGAVVKQHSLTSMTTTALQFNLMTPLNESRQLTTSGGGGLNRLFANPTTYAPPRDVRVEPLRNDEALPSQTTPVRLLRSASGSNTSLGFNFHTPLVAEGGQGSESRPSMVTTLGFSFAAQSHSPLVAASDRRSCSPPSPITASDHAEDTVPPSPNALTSGGKRHQLLGGLSLRF
uniref:Uncharacterized protein n=1 Tax=Plectus sambesii TaxID=2011161 RepID=A0A914XJR4_9BILA